MAFSASAGAATATDSPPPIVEDYSYPGAAQILQDRAIKLISGDGHIVLVACGSQPGLLELHAYNSADHDRDPGHYCFKVSGPTGYLRLEVPNAYQLLGDNQHAVQATVEINGQTSTVPISKTGWTGIGEGAGTDPSTLLELRASA
ncbi:hypothetical protein [Amycolatopsis rifamycinica]|uniref:Secreted protein n=1 Tax=Amycolatopsis rifamycinica TaxID=287986 RepID=A0A066U0B3_9PSEU|nr:hypothetical protein [Amycolatopsis rifamycinica]KDN20891.1 hypothetical protein DV20_18105 [Amycolatopsis rifamycinica]